MWNSALIVLIVLAILVAALVVLERLEFLSVFPRLRRRAGGDRAPMRPE